MRYRWAVGGEGRQAAVSLSLSLSHSLTHTLSLTNSHILGFRVWGSGMRYRWAVGGEGRQAAVVDVPQRLLSGFF